MTLTLFLQMILVINVIIVGITDMTDWQKTMKKIVSYCLSRGKICTYRYDCHLLDCSLCQVFHASNIWLIIYLLMGGAFHPFLLLCPIISALLTTRMRGFLCLVIDTIQTLIDLLYKLIQYLK